MVGESCRYPILREIVLRVCKGALELRSYDWDQKLEVAPRSSDCVSSLIEYMRDYGRRAKVRVLLDTK